MRSPRRGSRRRSQVSAAAAAAAPGRLRAGAALAGALALAAAGSLAGAAPAHAVVGGAAASGGRYPFMVSLRENGFAYCGGTLVAPSWVLTAAHCAIGRTTAELRAVVDQVDMTSDTGQDRSVDQIVIDSSYDSVSQAYDAALLHLSAPVGNVAAAVLVPSGNASLGAPGVAATVIGFGSTLPEAVDGSGAVAYPTTLQQTQVAIDSAKQCSAVFNGGSEPSIDNVVMLCAGGDGRHDACVGDSGGPLLVPAGGGWADVGITSWGSGCAVAGVPGVYVRLADPQIAAFVAAHARG